MIEGRKGWEGRAEEFFQAKEVRLRKKKKKKTKKKR